MEPFVTWAAIFQRVEPSVAAALGQRLRSMDYLPGQVIFAEGEPGDRLYAIAAGKVKIARRSPDGRQNLRTVLGPSDIFGELSVVDPGPRTSNATALTDVRVMSMDRSELRALMTDHPVITDQLLRMLARRLRRVIETQTDLVFTDVPGRLAKQLLQLAQQFGSRQDGAIRVVHDLTHEEIAQLVGASLVRVEKALTDFSRRGWIRLEGNSVLILDSEWLTRRARQRQWAC